MKAVEQGIYKRRGFLKPRKLHQTNFVENESKMSRVFEEHAVTRCDQGGRESKRAQTKRCFSKKELERCIPDEIVKRLHKINLNEQSIETLPKVSNFLFWRETNLNNRGIPPPKLLLGPSQDQESKNINIDYSTNKRGLKQKIYNLESGTTQSTQLEKIMRLDKGVQVSPKDQELQRRKKQKSKRQKRNHRVVQETKVSSVDELPLVDQQKNYKQPIRKEFLQPQIIETTTAQQRQEQQISNLPQVIPPEKGFQSDQSKDQQQTLEQDQIQGEMIVQSGVGDSQNDKVFQLQSQSQRAETKQQVASQSLFPLDQEEEKDAPNIQNVKDYKSTPVPESKPLFSKQSSPLFSAVSNSKDNQQTQGPNFQQKQSLFPTSLFQKKNMSSSQFQQISHSEQTQPKQLFASSGWYTSCQNLANNPFVTNWKQGQIQQYQQKHANSFSLFEGNPFSSQRNDSSSGGQLFPQKQQKSKSFTFTSKQDHYENNFNSSSLSQSSIFNRNSQSFNKKCDEGSFYRPTKSFTDNIKYVSIYIFQHSFVQTSRKQQISDDQDLFADCAKNVQQKRSWNRKRI